MLDINDDNYEATIDQVNKLIIQDAKFKLHLKYSSPHPIVVLDRMDEQREKALKEKYTLTPPKKYPKFCLSCHHYLMTRCESVRDLEIMMDPTMKPMLFCHQCKPSSNSETKSMSSSVDLIFRKPNRASNIDFLLKLYKDAPEWWKLSLFGCEDRLLSMMISGDAEMERQALISTDKEICSAIDYASELLENPTKKISYKIAAQHCLMLYRRVKPCCKQNESKFDGAPYITGINRKTFRLVKINKNADEIKTVLNRAGIYPVEIRGAPPVVSLKLKDGEVNFKYITVLISNIPDNDW